MARLRGSLLAALHGRPRLRAPRRAPRALDEHEEACLARLAADVEDLVKSYDYRFTGERGAAAESAWRRVVAVVAGRRGDDPEAHAGHAHPGTS